jgi:hypothetical protein
MDSPKQIEANPVARNTFMQSLSKKIEICHLRFNDARKYKSHSEKRQRRLKHPSSVFVQQHLSSSSVSNLETIPGIHDSLHRHSLAIRVLSAFQPTPMLGDGGTAFQQSPTWIGNSSSHHPPSSSSSFLFVPEIPGRSASFSMCLRMMVACQDLSTPIWIRTTVVLNHFVWACCCWSRATLKRC